MTAFITPFHVDMVRFGGTHATSRHAFGPSPVPAAPPPAAAGRMPQPPLMPPPKRIYLGDRPLGQGRPTPAALGPDTLSAVQSAAQNAVETLRYELEAVKAEADMVSGSTLRVQPDLYKSIAVVGPYLSPQEIRNVIILDCREIIAQAQRLLTGAAAPYITPDQKSILSTVVSDASAQINYMQNFDLADLKGANAKLAQEHSDTHIKAAKDLIDSVEQQIVTGEASSVPVREPGETAGGPGSLLALGALVAVGFILAEIL